MPAAVTDIDKSRIERSWVATSGLQDNAIATATRAAEPGRKHVITKVEASYSTSSTSGLVTVQQGATIVARKHIHGAGALDGGDPGLISANANEAVSAQLSASGTSGVLGTVTLFGFTIPD